jgi:hypothetical protein
MTLAALEDEEESAADVNMAHRSITTESSSMRLSKSASAALLGGLPKNEHAGLVEVKEIARGTIIIV